MVLEVDARAGDQVLDRARDEHFARPGQRAHPRPDVDRDAADVGVDDLELAGVQAGAHLQAEPSHFGLGRPGAADRTAGSVEGREESVPERLDLLAAMALELAPHHTVMGGHQVSPAAVAQLGGLARGVDDVGEHDGGQHPLGLAGRGGAPEQRLDLVQDVLSPRRARPPEVIGAGQLDEAGAADPAPELAPVGHRQDPVVDAMQHHRRHVDGRQGGTDVGAVGHAQPGLGGGGARRRAPASRSNARGPPVHRRSREPRA